MTDWTNNLKKLEKHRKILKRNLDSLNLNLSSIVKIRKKTVIQYYSLTSYAKF